MTDKTPILMWFRRDLRLHDHEALSEACNSGRPVIPVFINDEVVEGQGAAARYRLGLSVASLAKSLEDKGSKLILRQGKALSCLEALIEETGATAVWWQRLYDPVSRDRDEPIKSALKDTGVDARSFAGHVLFEPWSVSTQTGGFYRVYSPMWRSVRGNDVASPLATPGSVPGPDTWPASDSLQDWHLDKAMNRGAAVLAEHVTVGEEAARGRLGAFIANGIADYKTARDFPAKPGTSGLSENLTYGELSPRVCWHAGQRAIEEGKAGAEHFLKELVWREFAYHLAHHTPEITDRNWKPDWDAFPWKTDPESDEVTAWKQGRTGIPFVDAAMREMYVTGTMHNRGRMIVASYLTKHLMCHWKIGLDWFADCLIDWDPCSNAMGWQWSAGSGPDATPYFRVFNPETQLEKFDPDHVYAKRWIAEGHSSPPATALSYFDAIPRHWELSPDMDYPKPIVDVKEGRERALRAYEERDF
ncbi:cryptochrome/photolyase family protein [Flavimaricola marinus]|uniref:Deoxyribodipyrimidine photo-lyase n=1 Tax=Flavimaricola marinus TaxID=1819565 RepID=A0A238LIW4_9RHOB|nr:deoxyribodipyrimidine photo-lyase [Flavimaricola marinus]SMY09591.1 Deoxyribodipyrimidine photo-lyase [Flavimaricola marinus]